MENYLDAAMETELLAECKRSGFSEVWIADHTETEEYGTVELFGLFPEKYWGFHSRPWAGKPFG